MGRKHVRIGGDYPLLEDKVLGIAIVVENKMLKSNLRTSKIVVIQFEWHVKVNLDSKKVYILRKVLNYNRFYSNNII